MNNQFQKRVLIPFWILQILFLLIVVGTYAVVLWAFDSYNDDHPSTGNLLDAAIGVAGVFVAVAAFSIILDVVEIIKYARHSLSPLFFLISNCIKMAIWTVYFVISLIGIIQGSGGLGFFVALVLFLSILAHLIYASVMYHRQRMARRQRGVYAPASNPTHFNPVQPAAGQPVTSYEPYRNGPQIESHALSERNSSPGAPARPMTPQLRSASQMSNRTSPDYRPEGVHPAFREPEERYSQQYKAFSYDAPNPPAQSPELYSLPPPHPGQREAALDARYNALGKA